MVKTFKDKSALDLVNLEPVTPPPNFLKTGCLSLKNNNRKRPPTSRPISVAA
jgi:hypothetical protein